jgi:hypothetical protein
MEKLHGLKQDRKKCKTAKQIKRWFSNATLNVYARSTFVDLDDKN